MDFENTDVIELLEKKQKYHTEQISRIKLALSALIGTKEPKKASSGINQPKTPWTEKVMEVLTENGGEMSLDQILGKLAEKGITDALDSKNRQTIYSTLSRGVKNKKLEKAGYGFYRKKTQRKVETDFNKIRQDQNEK